MDAQNTTDSLLTQIYFLKPIPPLPPFVKILLDIIGGCGVNCLTVSVLILSFMMILDFLDIPYVNRYRLLWDFDFPTV